MTCSFEVYNGYSSKKPIISIPNVPCFEDAWTRNNVKLFNDLPNVNALQRIGRSYVKIDRNKIQGVLGEYQLVLKEIAYTVCSEDGSGASREIFNGISNDRVCAMNFAVSDNYLVHKGSSLSTSENTDMRSFKYLNALNVISREQLQEISDSTFSIFDSTQLTDRINEFVNNYSVLAILRGRYLDGFTSEVLKKVVNADIYFYDGTAARVPLVIK